MSDINLPSDQDLKLEELTGLVVSSAWINKEKDFVLLETNRGNFYLNWVGSCCAKCFIANISGTENLVGSTILDAKHSEWVGKTDEDCERYNVTENMGTEIKTTSGYISIETRLEHNGHYSGNVIIRDDQPLDQYHYPLFENFKSIKNIPEEFELSPLKDF